MKKCIYAGVFDPVHNGHADVITRLLKIFDEVIVAVLENSEKLTKASAVKRNEMISCHFRKDARVKIKSFSGLLTDFARAEGIFTVARGIRSSADYEYEKQLAAVYKSQESAIEVVYLAAAPELAHISSTTVRELVKLGGDLTGYIPQELTEEIKEIYK